MLLMPQKQFRNIQKPISVSAEVLLKPQAVALFKTELSIWGKNHSVDEWRGGAHYTQFPI